MMSECWMLSLSRPVPQGITSVEKSIHRFFFPSMFVDEDPSCNRRDGENIQRLHHSHLYVRETQNLHPMHTTIVHFPDVAVHSHSVYLLSLPRMEIYQCYCSNIIYAYLSCTYIAPNSLCVSPTDVNWAGKCCTETVGKVGTWYWYFGKHNTYHTT